ncbi:HNH endonuclease signature motif containing protein [Burkholderia gladioli]|uniref:HNH endonuclease signature motif containing protein n=1 Tax=Burkholderia gladioli TaxID=28095 RepID=UPI00163F8C28|nr:HNH endonuclease signature motif containing protein [Burkholderia gladioli]
MIDIARLHAIFSIDEETGRLFWKVASKHNPSRLGREAGVCHRNRGEKRYWVIKIDGHGVNRSRIVFAMVNGRWPDPCVDHINGDSLDDRPCNLREATQQQNNWNIKRRKKKSSLPMGVAINRCGRFVAQIGYSGHRKSIGSFATEAEASAAYQQKRKELFGEYA